MIIFNYIVVMSVQRSLVRLDMTWIRIRAIIWICQLRRRCRRTSLSCSSHFLPPKTQHSTKKGASRARQSAQWLRLLTGTGFRSGKMNASRSEVWTTTLSKMLLVSECGSRCLLFIHNCEIRFEQTIGCYWIRQSTDLFWILLFWQVEYLEVGSPVSNRYYLGAARGEIYGLDHDTQRFSAECVSSLRPKTDINGLYLSGAFLEDTWHCSIPHATESQVYAIHFMEYFVILRSGHIFWRVHGSVFWWCFVCFVHSASQPARRPAKVASENQ